MRMLALALILFSQLTCTESSSDPSPASEAAREAAATTYFQKSTGIDVQVWYQEGAEPYVKDRPLDRDLWQILRGNLDAIFQFRTVKPTMSVPSTLEEMNKLASPRQENWTAEQIVELWKANQNGTPGEGTSRFFIYFLDGYLNKEGVSNQNVLGVQIGDYPVIAIFKPVIASTAGETLLIPKFMEQSTLVHEMGHALGFVNHGVPMVENYQDSEHGAHSTDEECVMYWLNEGAENLKKFVQKLVTSQSAVLWGQNVLDDAKAFSR